MALTKTQTKFVKFLADLWLPHRDLIDSQQLDPTKPCVTELNSTGFVHQYEITNNAAWRDWKAGIAGRHGALGSGFASLRQHRWWCRSLKEACLHYSWSKGSAARFSQLSQDIKTAINIRDTPQVRALCLEIFQWGGVARKLDDASRLWVESSASKGTLIASLCQAPQLLQAASTSSLASFDGRQLLMNSAMTKVYVAVDSTQSIAMYDGRVGAALGLLARLFLHSTQGPTLPEDLAFLWGPMQGIGKTNLRNPSADPYIFKSLYASSITDQVRAEVSRQTNRILAAASRLICQEGLHTATVHDFEKALFMIGYRVQ